MTSNVEVFDNKDLLISKLIELASRKNNVFRGYSIQNQLLPNIVRKNLVSDEIELLKEFEKYGMQYINVSNSIDFMSYAQHFGLPTRLLDFTYNPFIALYFALYISKPFNAKNSDDNKYYYIRYCDIDSQLCFKYLPVSVDNYVHESSSLVKSCDKSISTLNDFVEKIDLRDEKIITYLQAAYWDNNPSEYQQASNKKEDFIINAIRKFEERRLLFIDSNQSNNRLVMQQGLFLFPYHLDKNLLESTITNNTSLIKIDKNLRDELKVYLDVLGIDAFRLMPDLSSVCDAVERKIKESKKKIF